MTNNIFLICRPKVQESLRLQKQFHTKQIDLIIIRREQHEKCLAAQAAVDKGLTFRNNLDDSRQVQIELYKSLDNVEKVVEVLEQKTLSAGNTVATEFLSKLFDDLKLMNQQSMLMVNQLVTQLDDRITENEDLREAMQENSSSAKMDQHRTGSLEAKKSRDLSDSDTELHKLEELAPLELPSFDFNTFSSSPGAAAGGTDENGEQESSGVQGTSKDNAILRRIGLAGEAEEGDLQVKD